MHEKNMIVGPADFEVPGFVFQGMPLLVLADLPEGGFLQIVSGDNPLAPAIPSKQIAKGAMVLVLPENIATQIRPQIRKFQADTAKALNHGSGVILPSRLDN